jgi:hypothetical protein
MLLFDPTPEQFFLHWGKGTPLGVQEGPLKGQRFRVGFPLRANGEEALGLV